MSNNEISSEFYETLINKLEAVQVYEDNYTLCQNAAYALRTLINAETKFQEEKH